MPVIARAARPHLLPTAVLLRSALAAYLFLYAATAGALIGDAWGRGAHVTVEQWAHHGLLTGLGMGHHHGDVDAGLIAEAAPADPAEGGPSLAPVSVPPPGPLVVATQSQSSGGPLLAGLLLVATGPDWRARGTASERIGARLVVPIGLPAAPPQDPPPNPS